MIRCGLPPLFATEASLQHGLCEGKAAVLQSSKRMRICRNYNGCALQGCFRYWKPNLELVKQEAGHREGIEAISFAPSDLKFATASKDSTVKVRDPAMHQSTDGHKLAHLCASPWCAQPSFTAEHLPRTCKCRSGIPPHRMMSTE